jgi:hypothetical protein
MHGVRARLGASKSWITRVARIAGPRGRAEGQTTAEYALVILGAAAIGTLLIAWATKRNAVGRLFDEVVEKILP